MIRREFLERVSAAIAAMVMTGGEAKSFEIADEEDSVLYAVKVIGNAVGGIQDGDMWYNSKVGCMRYCCGGKVIEVVPKNGI